MAIVKQLNTRIALKYDSYANWMSQGKDLILLKGEIGICEISATAQGSNVVPTVLFKVGDGVKTFEQLPWASAKAADVYGWAKASEVKRDGKKLVFVGGGVNGADLEVLFDYCTIDEVKAITNPLAERLAVVEGKFEGTNSVQSQINALDGRLDVIEGADTVEGSVAKALKDAKAYTDAREAEIKKYADQAEADALSSANGYTDGKVSKVAEDLAKEVEARETLAGKVKVLEDIDNATQAELDAYKEVVTGAIATAKSEAIGEAQNLVNGLANGQVATNAGKITKNAEDIARVEGLVSTEATNRENADNAIIERLEDVEAFFHTAEGETLDGALDTLKEIQDYLNGDGSATGGIIDRVAANETAIGNLNKEFVEGGRVYAAEAAIDVLEEDVAKKLDESTYTAWKNTHENDHAKSATKITEEITTAVNSEKALREAADTAINEKIGGSYSKNSTVADAIAGVKTTADKAKTDLAALTGRVDTAENNITGLKGIVETGADSNANLRSAITSLQELTKDGGAIRTEIAAAKKAGDDAAAAVDALSKGQVATNKSDISDLKTKVATIEGDYLKAADEFILQCGTSTTVTHVKAN